MASRTCGECNLCCTILAVPEVNKGRYEECEHMCESNCGLFNKPERPKVCGKWHCFWLAEGQQEYWKKTGLPKVLLKNDRPDKSGVMFVNIESMNRPAFHAYESWPGAFETKEAKEVLKVMNNRFFIWKEEYKKDESS